MSHLEVRGASKSFGPVRALKDATLSLDRGEIHGLCGANGAGKSTLIRILSGAVTPDSGEILLSGKAIREFTPQHSMSLGIGVVYQELALIPDLPVWKNIFLGIEHRKEIASTSAAMKARARKSLAGMGVQLDVETWVGELPIHQQQIVEIAKALCRGSSLLILDEPTAILNFEEKKKLFGILRDLKRGGLCILIITHFIDELFDVCDNLTVMRDGRTVQSFAVAETDRDAVVFAMVGKVPDHKAAAAAVRTGNGKAIIATREAGISGRFAGVTLSVDAGEVLGLAGLVGSGCYEVAESLFGLRQLDDGELLLDGRPARMPDPQTAVRAGIGYVPEDRRKKGLCFNLTSSKNTVLPSLSQQRFSLYGMLRESNIREAFRKLGHNLRLHPLSPSLPASAFSGGNQQKLVIGKWIEKGCRVYIFVEPTRGVDIGAKTEIWKTIERLAGAGAAILVVSTDFDDLAAVCSRCLVFAAGLIVGDVSGGDITPDRLSAIAVGARRQHV